MQIGHESFQSGLDRIDVWFAVFKSIFSMILRFEFNFQCLKTSQLLSETRSQI